MIVLAQGAGNALIYAALGGIGLLLAAQIGWGLPFVEGWVTGKPIWHRLGPVAAWAAVAGVIVGALIIALDVGLFQPLLRASLEAAGTPPLQGTRPPPWQGLLAAFSAGISEEVIFRLFGVTLIAWLGSLVSRDAEGRPSHVVFWIANAAVALLFGASHLPATRAIGLPLNALVVSRALALNGLGGVVFGWAYRRWGLESAMWAHFCADIVLHVLLPLVLPLFT
jgi:hypothetical protein